MKKLIMAIVCLMTMISANAQVNMLKIKQAALNEFKSTLIAPSQFVLTDKYGNKISINNISAKLVNLNKVDTIYYSNGSRVITDVSDMAIAVLEAMRAEMLIRKISKREEKEIEECETFTEIRKIDSIIVSHKYYIPVYEVTIIGDAKNRMGGYEQMTKKIYVDKKYNCYHILDVPYTEKKFKKIPNNLSIEYTRINRGNEKYITGTKFINYDSKSFLNHIH